MIALSAIEVESLARAVFEGRLPSAVQQVKVSPIVDPSGDPAFSVEAVVAPEALSETRLRDRMAASTELQRRLGEAGGDRFAYVHFTSAAEQQELAALATDD